MDFDFTKIDYDVAADVKDTMRQVADLISALKKRRSISGINFGYSHSYGGHFDGKYSFVKLRMDSKVKTQDLINISLLQVDFE